MGEHPIPSDWTRFRRPSATLEAGVLGPAFAVLGLMTLFSGRPFLESLAALGILAVICAVGATVTLSSVYADEAGIRIGWARWSHTRVAWGDVASVNLPGDRLPWGYPFIVTTDGGRVTMRPLRCHRDGWNHAYASEAIKALGRLKNQHDT